MKYLVLLLAILFAWGCSTHKKTQKKSPQKEVKTRTLVCGKIINRDVYPDEKVAMVTFNDFRSKKAVCVDSIKADGTFKVAFDLYITQDVVVDLIAGKILVHPGDSVYLNIDFKEIANVWFQGDSCKSNHDLRQYLRRHYSVHDFENREAVKLDLSQYKTFCDSVKTVMTNKRNVFIKEINPTAEVQQWVNDYINIQYYKALLSYPMYHQRYDTPSKESKLPPVEYYTYFDNIDSLFNKEMLNASAYDLLNDYTHMLIEKSYRQEIINKESIAKDSVESKYLNEIIPGCNNTVLRELLWGNYFYQSFKTNELSYFETHKAIFDTNINLDFIKIPLSGYYNEIKAARQHPEIESNAILSKIREVPGGDILDSILSRNKGKVVYIDCWATWCGPCKAEMPHSNELIKKFEGKDIVLAFLCVNSKEEVWDQTLKQLKVDGQHYFCNDLQSRAIQKGFEIKGIPYYILINKKGHITEHGSYLRPSNPLTQVKIEQLLKEE
jgi:thiol-disulfide isomerase/thioredoxin